MSAHVDRYDSGAIETKWQARWAADRLYERSKSPRNRYYLLTMYPYPSGDLHIGHWYAYTPADARARFMRMCGHDVFFPIGFDAFGLPAENAAIRHGVDPRVWTTSNIDHMRGQFRSMGAMLDWTAELVTADPEYYRWNQWFFLKFLDAGLAYRKHAAVDFCPSCNTTLAREQVVGEARLCERCGTPVVRKDLEQWFLRTTRYAEELLAGLDRIEWPERVKTMQRNWLGRSEGAEIDFPLPGSDDKLSVFTTRPDTLYGVTAMVLAPEHPWVDRLTTPAQSAAVEAYRLQSARSSEIDREAVDRPKTGVWTGGHVLHPLTGEPVPVWIADYVLMRYGTGAVMMVPGHDERDFAMARKYGLPVVEVIRPADRMGLPPVDLTEAYTGPGVMVNSGPADGTVSTAKYALEDWTAELAGAFGLPADLSSEGKQTIVAALEKLGLGRLTVTWRMRDWLISRQRYWGTPIPVVHCADCGAVPVAEASLPVTLPEGVAFLPTGESPLKFAEDWVRTPCPRCGAPARRDTDTMDTFVDSSWYQYRYLSPHYAEAPFDPAELDWLPITQYCGGIEHATMHLLYTRFWTRAMRDLGLVPFDEPMVRLFNQGLILGDDSEKMSKSRGNVTDPDDLVAQHGADAVRAYLMFIGPWDQGGPWDPRGIQGVVRWLKDVWALAVPPAVAPAVAPASAGGGDSRAKAVTSPDAGANATTSPDAEAEVVTSPDAGAEATLRRVTHQTIRKVGDDLSGFGFNTAVAGLMEYRNTLKSMRPTCGGTAAWEEAVDALLLLMAPLTPHIAEELWARRGRPYSIHQQPWPAYDPALAAEDTFEMAVQVLGKVRDRIVVPVGIDEDAAVKAALASEAVQRLLEGRSPKRLIYVPGRLVNIVV